MIVFAYLIMLFFCGALTFMIMTLIIGKKNIQEEEKDPVQFLFGSISYEINEELDRDYRTSVPQFITLYGYDRKTFTGDEREDT